MTAEVALMAYAGLSVVVPVTSLLLIRLIDRLGLDGYVDQYQQVSRRPGQDATTSAAGVTDPGRCSHCGERNECEFTFCRTCQTRIGS